MSLFDLFGEGPTFMPSGPPSAAAAGTITLGGELTVNRMGFGAMRLTGNGIWGAPADRDECRRVLRRAVELGVNFIDTADSYGPDVSEEIIAEALHPYPRDLVIATKAGLTRPGPNQWVTNGRPEHLRAACEGSLRRLRLDRLDLFQLHRIDPNVPEAEQFGVLEALRSEGKIRLIGVSEVAVADLARARQRLAVVSVQNKYNVTDRTWDPVLEACEPQGVAFIPWYPLGAGDVRKSRAIKRIARDRGASPMQVALAWLLARSPVMLPIPGTSKVKHLEENIAAASLDLGADVDALNQLAD
jgi:aryl-alcohol dehydrogenase-like predicted oxidoreductase